MAGIYIHVPFCKQKCTYCDFASYPKEIGKEEAYFACLYREMLGRKEELKEYTFNTVYFGGGTPSFVKPEHILGAMNQIKKCYNLTENAEITLEVNPGTLTEENLKIYKKAGINRFSIGLQSGWNEDLEKLNRIHTAKDFLLCTSMLKREGFENFSADILLGLENQTIEKVKKSIDLAVAGGVKHISMYALTPEVGTPIYTNYLNGELLSDDEVGEIYEEAYKYLESLGLYRYEVSNFASLGYESRHNLNYWRRGEYIGFGVSASSFINERRFTNSFKIDEYMNLVILNKKPEISSDIIELEDAMFEFIMLGLRTKEGININKFEVLFKENFLTRYKDVLKKNEKVLDLNDGYLSIKDDYLYVQNHIIMDFMK
ncbi:MAG: radical SAM family heme chaperone HemW [Clostridiales bacterium]|nr:radical SAM family heme chaperone HemW [Clostridiales bacterium]